MEGAVVGYAEGAVKGLVGKLGTVLANEALLLGSVRSEIQYIKDELESMTALLTIQAQKEDTDLMVKIWMKQVREMAYDAEDCIDKFRYHVDKPHGKGLSGIISKCVLVVRTLKARHQIATEIQDLKKRTCVVSERQMRYHAPSQVSSEMNSSLSGGSLIPYTQLQAMSPEQVQPVGFDQCRDDIIGWLMDENRPRLTVVSIVGFGGLGKTTLAKMAYESSMVKTGNFQCRAFVAVSQQFDVKLILADIFRQVLPIPNNNDTLGMNDDERKAQTLARLFSGNTVNWDVHTFVKSLLNYLDNKRYVIILDDVWTISAWEQFKIALPDCNNNSRIIVTTRIESVANECSRDRAPRVYKMKHLDLETSKMLFYKKIFGNDKSMNGDLESVSNAILRKCGGMPLAINSVAGLLASKPKQADQWRTILKSLGSELETNPTLEGMRKILFLSYQNLPHYLKTCFLYLSIYPEDFEIRSKSLMRRWIDEGFVGSKRGLRAEEVAKSYFYELVNRNMVIPVDINLTGEINSIRIHDMMLEIIVSKSLEENFVSLVGGEYNLTYDHKIRRLSVHSIGKNNLELSVNMNLAHIRSLTLFGNWTEWVKSKQLRLVRVLDLEGTQGLENDHLKYLGKMFQLRYLSLRGTKISRLPAKIKKLQSLEILNVRDTEIRKLPSNIVKLQNLSYINCGYTDQYAFLSSKRHGYIKMPRGIRNMKNIRTLTLITLQNCCTIRELGELSQITKLGVYLATDKTEEMKLFCSTLDKLCLSLRSLTISYPPSSDLSQTLDSLASPPTLLKSLQFRSHLEKLPLWFPSLNNLTKLKLIWTRELKENDFQILQKLPNLIILHQGWNTYKHVDGIVFVVEGFPSLRVFTYEAYTIPTLEFREGAAPKLEKLALAFRQDPEPVRAPPKLEKLEHLQSLKEVILNLPKRSEFDPVVKSFQDVINSCPNKFNLAVERFDHWL